MTSGKRIFVVTCVDHRLFEKEFEACVPQGPYFFTFVGGAMNAITQFQSLVDQLTFLEEKGVIFDEGILADHTNCAAHGGNESKEDHYVLLDQLAEMLTEKYPSLEVRKCLINLETKQLEDVPDNQFANAS